MNFYDAILTLEETGVVDVILPFMLIFVIVFAVLQKTKILGKDEDKKKFNVVLALLMGLSVVIPHVLGRYPPKSDPILIINNVLPNISLVMLAIISFMLIVGVFGADIKIGESTSLSGLVIVLSAICVLATFGVAAGWFGEIPFWLRFLEDEATQTLFVTILVMGIIIAFITKGPADKDKESAFEKLFKGVIKHND